MIPCFCNKGQEEPSCSCSSITFEEHVFNPPQVIVIKPKDSAPDSAPERLAEDSALHLERAMRDELLKKLKGKNGQAVEKLIGSYKKGAFCSYKYKKEYQSLLSLAVLFQAPLQAVQAVYNANPSALKQYNKHGMSTLHLACTVPTSLDVMIFLIMELQDQGYQLDKLKTPGGWSVIHTACSLGVLPLDSFLFVLKNSTSLLGTCTTKKSTPLHLALLGLQHRPSHEQAIMILQLVQSHPFAVQAKNAANQNPVLVAEKMVQKGRLDNDIFEFLSDVQNLVQLKYSHAQIDKCLADRHTVWSQTTGMQSNCPEIDGNLVFNEQESIDCTRIASCVTLALFKRNVYIMSTLAHIELQIMASQQRNALLKDELEAK